MIRKLWNGDSGQDIAEYAVMLAVMLILVIGAVRLIGGNANNTFSSVASRALNDGSKTGLALITAIVPAPICVGRAFLPALCGAGVVARSKIPHLTAAETRQCAVRSTNRCHPERVEAGALARQSLPSEGPMHFSSVGGSHPTRFSLGKSNLLQFLHRFVGA
jgi:Flp pilus assembly pilin Flp